MTDSIVIAIAILGPVISFAVSWGWYKRRWIEMDNTIHKHGQYHVQHFQHSQDQEAHWNKRERDDLSETLKEMRQDMKDVRNDLRELVLWKRNGGSP